MTKVFVGMSGGVDSSVSAALLVGHGYDVKGIYMKNWSRDLPGMKCPWADDLADAKRVAVKLGIPFEVWDFEDAYREKVVEYMLSEFKKGNTPNPDIMCNEEIKFKLFYERAMERGADFIATGHYARVSRGKLLRAVDENKDQTYFLYRISDEALSHTLFPIGDMLKPDVKKLAETMGLHNAYKKESMGVCFVGEVGMKDFLKEYIDIQPGEIREAGHFQRLGGADVHARLSGVADHYASATVSTSQEAKANSIPVFPTTSSQKTSTAILSTFPATSTTPPSGPRS